MFGTFLFLVLSSHVSDVNPRQTTHAKIIYIIFKSVHTSPSHFGKKLISCQVIRSHLMSPPFPIPPLHVLLPPTCLSSLTLIARQYTLCRRHESIHTREWNERKGSAGGFANLAYMAYKTVCLYKLGLGTVCHVTSLDLGTNSSNGTHFSLR